MSRKKAEAKRIVKRADFIRELLKEFGAKLHSFDPGVCAVADNGQFMDFGRPEWTWLEPLLIELRDKRMTKPSDSTNN